MNASQKKVVQYLGEAQATEDALVRVLQSQIAMTPRGAYRTALEQHLRQTRDHADRVAQRRSELGQDGNPLTAAVGVVGSVVGQALALGKTPFDLLRGSGGEEKILKNAKDAYASEALEIATYTAIERLARSVGDDQTAERAASIRADEEKMLDRVLREIPKLTDAVVREAGPGREEDGTHHRGPGQAHVTPGPQAPRRRPGRGPDQGRRRGRIRPGDPALRPAHRGGNRRQAGRAVANRLGQGRRVRAQEREPHHGAQPHQYPPRRRAVDRL
jgi:ferritin-like metal-binding protein YciE